MNYALIRSIKNTESLT